MQPLDVAAAFVPFPVLETPRCVLRQMVVGDADAVFRVFSDPAAMQYFGRLPMTDHSQAVERVEQITQAWQELRGIRWAIEWRESGEMIGSCGYWRIDPRHYRAEFGYELVPTMWGQGIMSEVLAAIIAYGFTTMNLHSIEAQIHPDNYGSQRVLEKNGFVQEGYFHQSYYDEYLQTFTDNAIFSLLKRDWQAAQ